MKHKTVSLPTFDEERALWRAGYRCVAGLDEVGRGALAGPVVAAAVVFAPCAELPPGLSGINDSKQVPAARRTRLAEAIRARASAVGVGSVEAADIDRLGIAAATRLAMGRALDALAAAGHTVDHLLIDFLTLDLPVAQKSIVKGDCRSLSIAAASIVAKVARDRSMTRLAAAYPAYGFSQHKGYGTAAHCAALRAVGPCGEHRRSFSRVAQPALPWGGDGHA